MFSYEDRNRAVKLYIKLGKRLGVTIRQLGCRRQSNTGHPCQLNSDQGLTSAV